MRPDVLVDYLGQTIRGLVGPMGLRVAELEAAGGRAAITLDAVNASLGDQDARLGTLAADVAALAAEVAFVSGAAGPLRDRITALEAREPIPGPPGPEGPAGPPGPAGLDGKSWNYLGVHVSGKTYDAGDLVTDHGSLFYCCRTTTGRPAASPDWKLMVKRGQDGKDAR